MEDVPRTFSAMLRRGDHNLGWIMVDVPFEPREQWPDIPRGRVVVNLRGPRGLARQRTSLFARSAPAGGVYVLVNRAMMEQSGLFPGDTGDIALQPDHEPRPATLPDALDSLLDEADGFRSWYETLPEYTRREIGKWICGAKAEAAQQRRAEEMAERLLATMQAEGALPPVLLVAFTERPRARQGWALASEAHRREELMALFSYKGPEARQRRLGKLLEAAELRAEKQQRRGS